MWFQKYHGLQCLFIKTKCNMGEYTLLIYLTQKLRYVLFEEKQVILSLKQVIW